MTFRLLTAISLTLLAFSPATAQTPAKTSKTPRTPDGKPDLQGYWTNATLIPFERPKELGTKEFYTEAEALAVQK